MQAVQIDAVHAMFIQTIMTGTNLESIKTYLQVFTDRRDQRGTWVVVVDPCVLKNSTHSDTQEAGEESTLWIRGG
jgi:hypothetical protein